MNSKRSYTPARICRLTKPKYSATQSGRIIILLQLLKYDVRITITYESLQRPKQKSLCFPFLISHIDIKLPTVHSWHIACPVVIQGLFKMSLGVAFNKFLKQKRYSDTKQFLKQSIIIISST